MILKLWKKEQVKNVAKTFGELAENTEYCHKQYANKVEEIANQYIEILNDNYGENRNPDTSLGGWVAIIVDESIENVRTEYCEFLRKYSLESELAEVSESIVECAEETQWILEIYIVSSDYGYVLLYPKE